MALHGLIFDFDGTLADTVPVCCAAFRAAFHSFLDREYSDAEIVGLFGPSEEGIIRRAVGDDWEACLRAYLDAYEAAHEACAEPFPGVPALLNLLQQHDVRAAIVTGKGRHSVAISLQRLDLDRYFEIVEIGSPDGPVKPATIRRILTCWELPADNVAYVGDSPFDMADARAAGVIPLAAAWATTSDAAALRASRPEALFDSVDELRAWIEHNVDG